MAWKTTGFQDIGVVRRLNTLASVFEEQIRLAIREQLGATYSPVVYNSSSRFAPDYGKLYVRIVTDAGQLAEVQNVVESISKDLIAQGVSEEDLVRVKKPTLTSLKDLVRTNNYWLNTVLSGSTLYPEQLRWPETIIDDHAAITAAEISTYAKRYLKPERMAVATVQTEN
jgi:zinc protease